MEPLKTQEFKQLRTHFLEKSAGDKGLWAELERRHHEPGRFYHTLRHVFELLKLLEPLQAQLERPDAVFWAIWFHDAAYDPRANNNEEQSAELARAHLGQLNMGLLESIVGLILATKTHQAQDSDARFLVDADLAILGSEPEKYALYARAVRQEYKFVPFEVYCAARAKVLQRFLERDVIYQTPLFREQLEGRARGNLAREISLLEARGAVI